MVPEIERNNWSIVLIGSFNPVIFHPAWLELNQVISKETAESAEVQLIHSEASILVVGNLRLEVQRNRFHIQTERSPEIQILDFVLRVFGDLLPHSQVTQFGINRAVFFRAPNSNRRTELGRLFAPTAPWGSFGDRIAKSEGATLGGTTGVAMREVLEEKEWFGHTEARLSPAYELNPETGIQVNINNHFELRTPKDGEGSIRSLEIIKAEFEPKMKSCEEIISAVLEHLS
jgi:hypothetical protein